MPHEDTGAETSAGLSIEDELTRAFDAGDTPSGDEAGTTADATARPTEAVGGEPNATTLEAPKHWSDGDRVLFAKAPREVQQRWIARETEQQKGLDAKFQEVAGFRREREQIDELFSPYARDLELRGMSRMQFMQSLVGAHKFLLESPREALTWLATEYGVDPKELGESTQSNPQLDKLNQGFQSLQQKFDGLVGSQRQAEHQTNLGRVRSFAEAKDEKGQLLHPHFDEVAEDVLALMKAGQRDLDKAYTKAVRMNDEVWGKVQAESAKRASAAADVKRKAEIDKAKRAGVTSETGSATGTARPKTLKEELETAFDGW